MNKNEGSFNWMFIFYPALAMMLGWGLRGHIGGGPFGAMIPGAMVALTLCILLKLPSSASSIIIVFAVIGIGLGGQMTYGQTLGFLIKPGTVWWGNIGTTLKGAIWGLLGGTVFSMGFVYRKLQGKTIITALLLMMLGMFLGYKLVNEPMLLYFSDPSNPRSESWAALLTGAIFLLIYLKFRTNIINFNIISRFALWGTVGGGLGFGLGGLWMVLSSHLPDVIFASWWKAMEFTFGFLLGAFLGYAAWLKRSDIKSIIQEDQSPREHPSMSVWAELGFILLVALLIFWLIPKTAGPFVRGDQPGDGFMLGLLRDITGMTVNYAFYGLILVLFIMRFPGIAWQLGITLTFCHSAIDLFRDIYPDINTWSPVTMHFFFVFMMTAVVAILAAYFTRKEGTIKNLFLLLIWSSIIISLLRLALSQGGSDLTGLSACEIICRKYFVDIAFIILAVIVSLITVKKYNKIQYQ